MQNRISTGYIIREISFIFTNEYSFISKNGKLVKYMIWVKSEVWEMIKALFFDLDDTLLWDQKSIKEAFVSTCKIAEERYGVEASELEETVREAARNLYSSYETYTFTQMIGINPFEGLWGNFLDDHDEFRKMKDIVPGYRKEAWTAGLKGIGCR